MANAAAAALGDEGQQLRKLLDDPAASYSRRFREFRKRIEPRRPELPHALADNLTRDAIADLIRVTRNAAGHPTERR